MDWAAEVLAHAIAVEREAARRYGELARRMAERHEGDAAAPVAAALQAERDARAFFEQARRVARDPLARSLAEEMAAEESAHIARIQALVSREVDHRRSS
jgi:rubrerythrin